MICKQIFPLLAVAFQQFAGASPLIDAAQQTAEQCGGKKLFCGLPSSPPRGCDRELLICPVSMYTMPEGWCKQCETGGPWVPHRLWTEHERGEWNLYGHFPKPNPELGDPIPIARPGIPLG